MKKLCKFCVGERFIVSHFVDNEKFEIYRGEFRGVYDKNSAYVIVRPDGENGDYLEDADLYAEKEK